MQYLTMPDERKGKPPTYTIIFHFHDDPSISGSQRRGQKEDNDDGASYESSPSLRRACDEMVTHYRKSGSQSSHYKKGKSQSFSFFRTSSDVFGQGMGSNADLIRNKLAKAFHLSSSTAHYIVAFKSKNQKFAVAEVEMGAGADAHEFKTQTTRFIDNLLGGFVKFEKLKENLRESMLLFGYEQEGGGGEREREGERVGAGAGAGAGARDKTEL
jgi:hypothetical protein